MSWLAGGILYSLAYLVAGWYLRENAGVLVWLRVVALSIPPLTGIVIIARRRGDWTGCQWLFWATVALGLSMTTVSVVGWTLHEVLLARETSWLGWYSVFALFGAVAPLLALLAQPHRGSRDAATPGIAVDIAGIAVMTGFLYSHFLLGSDLASLGSQAPSVPLVLLQEFQQFVVGLALTLAALTSAGSGWSATYRRLATGLLVGLATLTISSLGILQGLYRSGGVYDVVWILPFAFVAWSASAAPGSAQTDLGTGGVEATPTRPWLIFGALGALPLVDFWLRRTIPIASSLEGFRDISLVITILSVLPLLIARLAVENTAARQADRRRLLLVAATEQADDLISIMTPSGRVEYGNAAFCRALGYEPDEISRMSASDFLAEESRAQLEAVRTAAPVAEAWRGTLVRRRKNASTFTSTCSIVALTDGGGRVTNFVAVERDVSQELQLRDQLIHSERLAAVGQLVSGVAHELNNPLQSIVGFTELLLLAERRLDARADLEQVRTSAHRAAKIVKNLLAFVRRSATERVTMDLNEIVQSTISLRRYELGTTGVELQEEYAGNLPPVQVNREEIQQIILNLVLNAEQAMQGAGGRGRLSVRTVLTSASDVAVEIQDAGPGVPAAVAGRIFEPFFSTKNVGEGTGLGLSIALGIAEAHGGSLELVPAASGACFRLTLPTTTTTTVMPAPDPAGPPEAVPVASGSGRRALVVDDEADLRVMLERLLAQRGFSVDLAEDGRPACGLLEQHHYDLILCDLQMPHMDGVTLLDWIRTRQPKASSTFVFVTGALLPLEMQSLIESSRVPVLSKPFGAAALDILLGELCPETARA